MQKLKWFGWAGLVAVCLVGLVSPTGVLAQNSAQGLAKDGRLLAQTRPTLGAIEPAPKMGHPVALKMGDPVVNTEDKLQYGIGRQNAVGSGNGAGFEHISDDSAQCQIQGLFYSGRRVALGYVKLSY